MVGEAQQGRLREGSEDSPYLQFLPGVFPTELQRPYMDIPKQKQRFRTDIESVIIAKVVIMIATMSYMVAVKPPARVWQETLLVEGKGHEDISIKQEYLS